MTIFAKIIMLFMLLVTCLSSAENDISSFEWYANLNAKVKAEVFRVDNDVNVEICKVNSRYWGNGRSVTSIHEVDLGDNNNPTLVSVKDELTAFSGEECFVLFPNDVKARCILTRVPNASLPFLPINHRSIFGVPSVQSSKDIILRNNEGFLYFGGDKYMIGKEDTALPFVIAYNSGGGVLYSYAYKEITKKANEIQCKAIYQDNINRKKYVIAMRIVYTSIAEAPATEWIFQCHPLALKLKLYDD